MAHIVKFVCYPSKNMGKVSTTVIQPDLSRNTELVSSQDISMLEGKLKTFIESLGFEDHREKATKSIINIILWDWFTYIRDHKTDHLSDKQTAYLKRHNLIKRED